jgi:hypothetical protein
MKPAWPWMLAHLKIIWQFYQKVSRFFGPRYIGDDFFLGPNLVSFNRAGFFNKHGWTYCRSKKNSTFCKHRFPGNTLTHSTNEDLLNIKRKGDPEVLYRLSYVRYLQRIWNRHGHECSLIWKLSGNFIELSFLYSSYRSLRNLKS